MASNVTGVNVRNAEATMHALRAFDESAHKALQKGLRKALRPIQRAAQADVPDAPLSQWAKYGWIDRKGRRERDIGWNAAKAIRGIQVVLGGKRQRGRIVSNLAGLKSNNAAAAIFELAGSKSPGNPLDVSLHRAGYGGYPRLILKQDTPANRAAVERDITAAMHEAERTLQRHLDRME